MGGTIMSLPLIVVLGATGTQGGSVVSHFLSLSPQRYRVRAVTRNPSSPKAQTLAKLGAEIATADVDDLASLQRAFKDANAIFANTDFWAPYFDPKNADKGKENGIPRNQWAYNNELQQGKNIFQAASEVPSLERLVYSALADTTGLSNGKYTYVFHFASKGHAANYAREHYPELMAKTSVVQIGGYLSNWLSFPALKPRKNPETGAYIFSSPLNFQMPLVAAEEDTGPFVDALLKVPPGKNLLGFREKMSVAGFAKLWGETLDKKVEIQDPMAMGLPPGLDDEGMGLMRVYGETGQFADEFGYAGEKVDKTVILPNELGVEIKLPSIKDWIKGQDWSGVL